MSILSVFTVLLLTMLLGMVMNLGRAVDGKIRMQNAADAASYSGGVVLARGMNTLAFTNHLLCDIFAVTAIMREANERNAEQYVPSILKAWTTVAEVLRTSGIQKFDRLGEAIPRKTPLEQEMVRAYCDWAAEVSQVHVLPLFEQILAEEMIPQYQRAVREAYPALAQEAAAAIAHDNGAPEHGRGPMLAALWRTTGAYVGDGAEAYDPSLPVVDPLRDGTSEQLLRARESRRTRAQNYLNDWNNETLADFDYLGKMSQFGELWRSFTCGQLEKLLDENANRNLPFQIQVDGKDVPAGERLAYLGRHFAFLGAVYWKELPALMPGVFANPAEGDAMAYAEVLLFVPRARLEWQFNSDAPQVQRSYPRGGAPGHRWSNDASSQPGTGGQWGVGRQNLSESWDLWNQYWTCQLVPATGPNLGIVLGQSPPTAEFSASGLRPPPLAGLRDEEIVRVSPH